MYVLFRTNYKLNKQKKKKLEPYLKITTLYDII